MRLSISGTVNNIKIICSIRFSLFITIDRFYKLFFAKGAFVNRRPEMISPPLFHPARTLSGSLCSPPSPRGEGFVRRYSFSTHACIRSDDLGIALFSQTAYLRRSSSLFFIPLPPSNLRPFGAPPSLGRREYPREPLPLEGAAERSEAGLASFFCGARVLSYNGALETIFPTCFSCR